MVQKFRFTPYLIGLTLLAGQTHAAPAWFNQLPEQTQCANNRYAMVIANGAYPKTKMGENHLGPLRSPKADADLMVKTLQNLEFCLSQQTVLLDADRATMDKRIRQFVNAVPQNATALFYYSGHGIDVDNKNYLIPVGEPFSSQSDVRHQGVNANWIIEKMREKNQQGANLMVLDACRDHIAINAQKGALNEGFTSMKIQGVLVAYAAEPGKPALGNRQGGASPYTQHLTDVLAQKADHPIELVLKEVRNKVFLTTNERQFPTAENNLLGANLCLAPEGCNLAASTLREELADKEAQIAALQAQLAGQGTVIQLPTKPTYAPLQSFQDQLKDGSLGPVMVSLPGGSFDMGDISGDGHEREKPVHKVTLKPFAMGQTEVANAQYVAFLNALKGADKGKDWFVTQAEDDDSRIIIVSHIIREGNGYRVQAAYAQHPVTYINWHGAQAYAKWLSEQTGEHYFLPSEAQWEYAARAGSRTKYSWGNENPVCDQKAPNGAQMYGCEGRAAKVGSFAANAFGLHDMHGNVWEWTQDCWYYDYKNAPTDGTAWEAVNKGDCAGRVVRGGGWFNEPWFLRSAFRDWSDPANTSNAQGFRLARANVK